MASDRREIDEVRSQAAAVAADYATENARLDAIRDEAKQLIADGEKARQTIADLEHLMRDARDTMERLTKERSDLEASLPKAAYTDRRPPTI